jgi:hypothetical protein
MSIIYSNYLLRITFSFPDLQQSISPIIFSHINMSLSQPEVSKSMPVKSAASLNYCNFLANKKLMKATQ